MSTKFETVDALIDRVSAAHPDDSPKGLAAYFEAVHQELAPLARQLEKDNKALREANPDEITVARWLVNCRFAVGDDGKRMLPEFVDYLKEIKQQRDELKVERDAARAEIERLTHNLQVTTDTMREYEELAKVRLAEIARMNGQESSYCSEERPCIPCFTDNGPCDEKPADLVSIGVIDANGDIYPEPPAPGTVVYAREEPDHQCCGKCNHDGDCNNAEVCKVGECNTDLSAIDAASVKGSCLSSFAKSETQAGLMSNDETQTSAPAIVFYPAGSLGEHVESKGG